LPDVRYAFPLGEDGDDVAIAPLLCAGLIGWRSLVMAGSAKRLGVYGFGAAGHIVAQVARWQGRSVYAFTRSDDVAAQDFARRLGAVWAGASGQMPDAPLDAAIIFAPAGELVPAALRVVRKGGRVVCAGIHMSDIPSFPYDILWEERQLVSVANLTRQGWAGFPQDRPTGRNPDPDRGVSTCRGQRRPDKNCGADKSWAPRFSNPRARAKMTTAATADSRMQENVFAFLTDPATHPHVHRIDTHAASVFLEGDRALKIKRAIRFPFLDYSTLGKRKAACYEEIRINRQFAPQVYHRVVAITLTRDGSLEIGGKGEPVEYAVEMSRFDERQTIDHLARGRPARSRPGRRHCGSDRDLPRGCATGAGPTLDQFDSGYHRRQYRGVPGSGLLSRRRHRAISGRRRCRRLPGFAACWRTAAGMVICDAATATCIWRTLY